MNKKVLEDYAKRGAQCDIMKALTLLTQAYISQCGISLGLRTLISLSYTLMMQLPRVLLLRALIAASIAC